MRPGCWSQPNDGLGQPALADAWVTVGWEVQLSTGPFIPTHLDALPGPESLPAQCDVAVIGAGLAGVALSLYLAREGVDVVTLEARRQLGCGATGRCLGHVELGVVEHPHRTITALGGARASQLYQWTDKGKALLAQEGLLQPQGMLWVSIDPREPEDIHMSSQALADLGRAAQQWSATDVSAASGLRSHGTALHLPDDGWIDPHAAVRTLAERARNHGAQFFGSAEATLEDDGGDEVLVRVGRRVLRAGVVIIAAGAQSGEVDPALAGRVTPVREQALRTVPATQTYSGLHRAGQGWTTWRQLPDRSLVVSGARWALPHMGIGDDDDTVTDGKVQAKLEAFLSAHLESLDIVDRWSWTFASTPDGLPLVGRLPGDPRRLVCAGFGPSPIAMSMAAARSLVDGLMTGSSDTPRDVSPRRLVRWRVG